MARDESRVVMESLAEDCPEVRRHGILPEKLFLLNGFRLHVIGYSRGKNSGNYGKTDDKFLVLSPTPPSGEVHYDPARDAVDFMVLLELTVRPWRWTILSIGSDGQLHALDLSAQHTIV
jgi:hypothetical protein